MASEAQINANRANAQKSTGPRTAEGKAVASRNAVTHGFLAQETVIQGEDPGEFAFYRDRMLGDLAPAGEGELDMAERIVGLAWRLRRAERLQTDAFDALYEKAATGSTDGGTLPGCVPEPGSDTAGGTDRTLGRMLVEDFSNARVLERLLLYERRIENSLYRTLRELREQKRLRLAGAPAEAISRMCERASGGTGTLPVVQDRGQDAHATGTSSGVPMNVPLARESLCKTNPISGGAGDDSSRNELRKTNPIFAEMGETAVPRGKEGGNDPLQEGLCETNPISRGDPASLPAVRRVA